MRVDLSAMKESQLTGLIARAERRKTELEKEAIASVRRKIRAIVESEGLTLKEVLGELGRSRRTVVVGALRKHRRH